MSTVCCHFPVLIHERYAGFREMTAANVVVVEEAGTSSGSTILLFAGGRQGLAHHPGPAGLQAVTARNEEVLVLQVARASALSTVSSRIPDDYFRFIIVNRYSCFGFGFTSLLAERRDKKSVEEKQSIEDTFYEVFLTWLCI